MANIKNNRRNLIIGTTILTSIYAILSVIAKLTSDVKDINKENPYLVEEIKIDRRQASDYIHKKAEQITTEKRYDIKIKPIIDKILSFSGLIILSPLFGLISVAIFLDDPGPVFFTQKRVGKDKIFFKLHKFRSMKMITPHDVPTHMLENPEQYITKVGRVLRKTSLDELPQIWDIFRGKMSIIGPRPALWNQEDLIEERERYKANDIKPGLTGWAQINGRDKLEISEKAKLDGEYAKQVKQGGFKALFFDGKCFLKTIQSVVYGDGIVEGRTREK